MKKRLLSLTLALLMCLSLIPMTALAAEPTVSIDRSECGPYSELTVTFSGVTEEMVAARAWIGIAVKGGNYLSGGQYWEYLTTSSGTVILRVPMDAGDYEVILYKAFAGNAEDIVATAPFAVNATLPQPDGDELDYSGYVPVSGSWAGEYDTNWDDMVLTESGDTVSGTYTWDSGKINATVASTGILVGTWAEAPSYAPPNDGGDIVFFMLEGGDSFVGWWRYGSEGNWAIWEPARRKDAPATYIASNWAQGELAEADELGLIPEVLEGADLTQDITRAEFAAVAVKVYENLGNTTALPATENPFTDCADVEVLKAYNVGITNGTSDTTFTPDQLLNREQAATMLTRVFKRVTKPGWTLATDSQFTLSYTKPDAFADDADISGWAKDSVYFMKANGIIGGVGENKFAPKNVTTEEQATGYANATREQALLIAVRMVKNLDA